MKTKITRRTTLGYAVNTSPVQDNSGYHFELPTSPEWWGTCKTLSETLSNDGYLNSLKDTLHSAAWFVKVNGTWRRVVDSREFTWVVRSLVEGMSDSAEIDVE